MTSGRMRYLDLMEFQFIPQDRPQKKTVFKLPPETQGLPNALKLHTKVNEEI